MALTFSDVSFFFSSESRHLSYDQGGGMAINEMKIILFF